MPRTLPAALTTVMDAGIFEPYIRVKYNADPNDTLATTVQPLGFKLSALNAEVKIPSTSDDTAYFCIVRGALISGTPSTISSIWFKTVATQEDGRFTTLIGEPLHRSYLVITANSDYETVIETALADTPIVPSYEGTAGWKAYQFYPTGKSIILSPRKKIFTILQQKYLIFATEDGWDGVNNNMFFFVATETRATDYSITDPLFTTTDHEETRRLITRDEASVVRSNGSATAIIHNLGFLHSTASLPTNTANGLIGGHSSKVPVHLKYRTGDQITITRPNFTTTRRFKVTEVLDLQSTPAWYMILETLEWFGGTEGGPLPSTIEAAAPYTPLATGNFDGVLSANDNNLQAAMETIDDHTHTGISTEEIQDTVGAMFSGNTETGIVATYQDTDGTVDLEVTPAGVGAIPNDGWIAKSETWTRTGNHTFTVSGDVTTTYRKGTKIRYKDGGAYEYGYIYSSSYSSPNTTVTLTTNSNYAMAAATITDTYISYIENPEGHPLWLNWSTTWGGFSANPATYDAKYMLLGSMMICAMRMDNGTSNSTTFTFTLPNNPTLTCYPSVAVIDNSADQPVGFFHVASGSTTVNVYKSLFVGFTASNLKRFNATVFSFLT